MDEKTEFSQRLRKAIEDAGYPVRPTVLEREFNTRYWGRSVTVQAVRRWLCGEAIPSQEKLQVLAEWLKIEPQRCALASRRRSRYAPNGNSGMKRLITRNGKRLNSIWAYPLHCVWWCGK